MKSYETLSEAINDLVKQGYTYDFNMEQNCIACKNLDMKFNPDKFEIVKFYRFEGMTNPDDESILYVIDAGNGIKGTMVDAYGAYSDALSFEMLQKLKFAHK